MSILIASSNTALITRMEEGVFSFPDAHTVNHSKHFKDRLTKIDPDLLLLDSAFLTQDLHKAVLDIINTVPKVKIIIFGSQISDAEEWALFKSGIRGYCHYDMKPEQINYAIKAVQREELWIRRSLTGFMLQELVEVSLEKDRIENAIHSLLSNLTKREYEIAMLVGRGESNKKIANRLEITERTVKAHLTEIFRKLQISDRIKLALMMKDTISSLKPTHVNHTYYNPSYFV